MSPWSQATWFQCAPLKATHRPSRPLKDTPPQSLRIAARQTLPPRHVPGLLRVQDLMFLVVLSMGMFLVFHDVLQSETKAVLCTNKLAYFCGMLLCLSFFFYHWAHSLLDNNIICNVCPCSSCRLIFCWYPFKCLSVVICQCVCWSGMPVTMKQCLVFMCISVFVCVVELLISPLVVFSCMVRGEELVPSFQAASSCTQ